MRPLARRGYPALIALFGVSAFGVSATGAFWVVFLHQAHDLPPAGIAALLGLVTLVAAAGSIVVCSRPSIPATACMVAGLACVAGMQVALALLSGPALHVLFFALYGAYIPLFYLPWNTLVMERTQAADRGAKLAGVFLSYAAVSIVAPLLGGVLAGRAGYPALFLAGAAVLAVAAGLAAALRQDPDRVRISWEPKALGRRMSIAYAAQGGTDGVLWTAVPLVTFSFVQQEVELGALFALFALAGGVIAVLLGRFSDRIRHRRRFVVLGALASVPIAVGVAFAPNLLAFSFANGALSASLAIAPPFLMAVALDRLEGRAGLVVGTREVLLNTARVATSAGIVALFLLGVPVQLAFLVVAALLPFEALAR